MKQKNLGNLHFTETDVNAILCALPLLSQIEADTPAQDERNRVAITSAGEKLLNRDSTLSAEEIRVISAAISVAVEYLSGHLEDLALDVDDEWKKELNTYFFTLNRLDPVFQRLVDEIQRRLHL